MRQGGWALDAGHSGMVCSGGSGAEASVDRWADSIRMFFSKLLGEEADDCVWIPFTQDRDSWKRLEDDFAGNV